MPSAVVNEAMPRSTATRQALSLKPSITVDASYRVEDLEEFFSINIPRNENDETSSVGGLVYEKINRIPKNNEVIDFNNELRIKIVKSNNRKIEIVEVNKNN